MARDKHPRLFLAQSEQEQVAAAIQAAERRTSGEIRVFVERHLPLFERDPYRRARSVFAKMGMHATAQRNGALVYLATASHCYAIVGDEELHKHVGDGFWREIADEMGVRFAKDDFGGGLAAAIQLLGDRLAEFFPFQDGDVNELSDDISFGR